MNCIEIENLSCGFGPHRLFEGVSLTLGQGQRVRIAGPSGCGKSTLLKSLMGFVPVAAGTICIEGTPLSAVSVWTLRQKLAYLAQEPELGSGLAGQRLREPFGYRHNAAVRFDENALSQWLEYFYLPQGILQKDVKTLSGGEKQRLAVIVAVMLGRTTFLLDEPVSAMDAASRLRFTQMFEQHREWTALFVSHDESLASLAERTVDIAPRQGGLR